MRCLWNKERHGQGLEGAQHAGEPGQAAPELGEFQCQWRGEALRAHLSEDWAGVRDLSAVEVRSDWSRKLDQDGLGWKVWSSCGSLGPPLHLSSGGGGDERPKQD